ncbi:MAG: CHASE2 domain-containing protein [Candidatus Omnitrophica bacterium]|nr:CHASE2 domain-containing protein [Candidatus Omnitrophota bacterium]
MKKNQENFNFLFIGFCALIISYLGVLSPTKFSLSLNDLPLQYIHRTKTLLSAFKRGFKPLKVVAVGIDIDSIEKIPGRFPFPRSVYADLIKKLDEEKVNTIGFDLVLTSSSEPKDDLALAEVLKNVSRSKVVLAFMLGSGTNGQPYVLPQPEFRQNNVSLGYIGNQNDLDSKNRRLCIRITSEPSEELRYSLAVQLAASLLNKPAATVAQSIPVFKKDIQQAGLMNINVENMLINYVTTPEDNDLVTNISFHDLYFNLESLKKKYGRDFLKDSLVLVYPQAEIIHDTVPTPLGKIPGGFLHINGLFEIISAKFLVGSPMLTFVLFVLGLGLILFSLRYMGFFASFFVVVLFFIISFWASAALWLQGRVINLAQLVIFSAVFFAVGNTYKYVLALLQLEAIKNKVVLDPLRNFYTLRYFYYHFDLAARKFYPGKELHLFFIYMDSLKNEIQTMPLNSIRSVWQKIQSAIKSAGGFWATYSSEEIVGGVFYTCPKAGNLAQAFRNTLQAMFKENNLNVPVKVGYLKVKKEYSPRELLFAVSREMKKSSEEVVCFDTPDFERVLNSSAALKQEEHEFLQSIDADIEEKNRELLEMIESLSREQAKSQEMFFQVILSLVNALEARDPYSEGHSQRVTGYALKLADKLGWNKEEKEKLRKAGLLHDLGKIGIPDSILHKQDKLNDEEFDFIKKHEIIGVKILEPIKEMAEILPWILYHHERWDGKGYPHGLGGNAIPLGSQIISLADVYDALTTGRDYKKALSREDSLAEIERNKGSQFNAGLTETFIQLIREEQAQK